MYGGNNYEVIHKEFHDAADFFLLLFGSKVHATNFEMGLILNRL